MVLKDKENCCGCTACYTVCPQKAITMQPDEEGFLYPRIDDSLCVECGLCQSVCRFQTQSTDEHGLPDAYVAAHKSLEVLKQSTSGGVFTALSDFVLNRDGVVYGASYNCSMKVEHRRATTKIERDLMRGSKYIQSDLKDCYHSVKMDLLDGKYVLFTGTPCQVDGLYGSLGNVSTDRLLTCDVICYGVSSPKVFDAHVQMLEKKYHTKLRHYECRPANRGHAWGCSTERATDEKGREIHSNAWIGLKRRLFYANVDKRPACHNCGYCNFRRPGDFTMGDCRNAGALVANHDFFYGVSTLLVNTPKAKDILPELQQGIDLWQTSAQEIVQPPLREIAKPFPHREKFWNVFHKKGYVAAVKACFGRAVIIKDYLRLSVFKRLF